MNSINIRPAITGDADRLATLFMRAWHVSLKDITPEGFLDQFSQEKQREKYVQRAADPGYFLLVADYNGKIIGMIAAKDNDSKTLDYQKEIRAMYIDPDFQRQGVGTLLFESVLSEFRNRNVSSAMLWCIKANKAAAAFYERHGGKRIETNIRPPEEYSAMPHVMYIWKIDY